MASDQQKLLESLDQLASATSALLTSLASPPAPPDPPLALASLHADHLSLLALIANDTTRAVLALDPPGLAPSFKGALAPLRDLAAHLSTLASNAASFSPPAHGAALAAEVRGFAAEVLGAAGELARALAAFARAPPRAKREGGGRGEAHMVRAATLYALVDGAREGGLSGSNAEAVRRRWAADGTLVRDALEELADEGDAGDEGEDEDEEFSLGGPSSAAERDFQKQLHTLVASILSTYDAIGAALPALGRTAPPAALDALLPAAAGITRAVDELCGCAYDGPDELPARKKGVIRALRALGGALDAIARESEEPGGGRWFAGRLRALVEALVALRWPEDAPA